MKALLDEYNAMENVAVEDIIAFLSTSIHFRMETVVSEG